MTNEDKPMIVLLPEGELRTESEHRLWLTRRQAIIMELGAIEDYLGMPRSIVPKRKREHADQERRAS